MLERPGGASVAEIGQRLGWLPHTVRAAITGLRHAGREVTRSKDAKGHSVYRLALVETAPGRGRPLPPDKRKPARRPIPPSPNSQFANLPGTGSRSYKPN